MVIIQAVKVTFNIYSIFVQTYAINNVIQKCNLYMNASNYV